MVTRQHTEQKSPSTWAPARMQEQHDEQEQRLPRSSLLGLSDPLTLSDSQLEILDMLEERPPSALAQRASAEAAEGRGFGVDVAFAAVGSLSILTGIAMLFFFAALGSILLVTGAILCAVAFEHVALSDLSTDELDLEQTANAAVGKVKPIL